MGLVVSEAQVISFQAQYDWVIIDEIAAFLLQHCESDHLAATDARAVATHAYHRGKQLGLRKKPALKMFAYLVVETGGKALTAPEIEAALTEDGASPDAAMDEIFNVAGLCAAQAD
jgi:hypothetical protein